MSNDVAPRPEGAAAASKVFWNQPQRGRQCALIGYDAEGAGP